MHHVTEREIDAATEQTENVSQAVIDKFMNKKMGATSTPQHVANAINGDYVEGGY